MDWTTLKVGDKIVESGYGTVICSIVKTNPCIYSCGKITFTSETEGGVIIDYMTNTGTTYYSPNISLYSSICGSNPNATPVNK